MQRRTVVALTSTHNFCSVALCRHPQGAGRSCSLTAHGLSADVDCSEAKPSWPIDQYRRRQAGATDRVRLLGDSARRRSWLGASRARDFQQLGAGLLGISERAYTAEITSQEFQ